MLMRGMDGVCSGYGALYLDSRGSACICTSIYTGLDAVMLVMIIQYYHE